MAGQKPDSTWILRAEAEFAIWRIRCVAAQYMPGFGEPGPFYFLTGN
jgi:hypothetical protein